MREFHRLYWLVVIGVATWGCSGDGGLGPPHVTGEELAGLQPVKRERRDREGRWQAIALIHTNGSAGSGGWEQWTLCISYENPEVGLGCELVHPQAVEDPADLNIDFDASTSPQFPEFVERLTDGVDERINLRFRLLDATGQPVGGTAGGRLESEWFRAKDRIEGVPDLAGHDIAFIRNEFHKVRVTNGSALILADHIFFGRKMPPGHVGR